MHYNRPGYMHAKSKQIWAIYEHMALHMNALLHYNDAVLDTVQTTETVTSLRDHQIMASIADTCKTDV